MNLAALAERYGTSEASITARLAFLGIHKPSQVREADLDRLDAIAEHLATGKPLSSFSYTPTSEVEVMVASETQSALTRSSSDEPFIEANLDQLERIYGFLQKAADNGWHLPTSVIRSLTGATPKGRYWKRYGFEFLPATRHGGERAWAVSAATWDFPTIGGR